MCIYYIVESEIFSISLLVHEDIDHMTFQFAFEHEISQFFAWDYIINRTLHAWWLEDMTFIFSC